MSHNLPVDREEKENILPSSGATPSASSRSSSVISNVNADALVGLKMEANDDLMMAAVYQPDGGIEALGSGDKGEAMAIQPAPAQAESNGNGQMVKPVPGTSLKCLDDPSFMFDAGKAAAAPVAAAAAVAPLPPTSEAPAKKKPMYRVLEDPFEAELLASSSPAKTAAADPMTSGIYEPSSSSSGGTVAAPGSDVIMRQPQANEVLEGAREKFDKFWGGKSSASPRRDDANS